MRPANAAEARYLALVKSVPCLICTRFERTGLPSEVHHIASGSSLRSHWLVAPLCGSQTDGGHHRGGAGLHGMGTRRFCSLYQPPGELEHGLLAWLAQDMERLRLLKVAA